MQIPITTPEQLGRLIRAKRKSERLRQDDTAGAIGMSDVSLGQLERGAPGARLDKTLRVLHALGIELRAEVDDEVGARYAALAERLAERQAAPRAMPPAAPQATPKRARKPATGRAT